jgi:RNA polymerase sigma factor (TIGR02999 family)
MDEREDITALLQRVGDGDGSGREELFELVYDRLREMARDKLRLERSDHTLRATDLVHEAYLRLVDPQRAGFQNRAHFLAAAGQAMRRILVDHARRRARKKRGGGWKRVPFQEALTMGVPDHDDSILALDEALELLGQEHPEKARLVDLHIFGGLTQEECAGLLGVSRRTVLRHWDFAQSWLYLQMVRGD